VCRFGCADFFRKKPSNFFGGNLRRGFWAQKVVFFETFFGECLEELSAGKWGKLPIPAAGLFILGECDLIWFF